MMLGAGPFNPEGILGRYHRSSSASREPRLPLHQGRPLLAGLYGRYRTPAHVHADRRGPASSRAPRTRGWRQLPGARQSPIRASSVSPAFVHLSSAWKWLLNGESFCPSFVPANNTWLGFATEGAQGLVRIFATQSLNLVFPAFRFGACGKCRTGLSYEPSRKASRPSGFDPSRDHESLAGGTRPRSRRHFIPASLSLPFVRVPF